jgi:hypothetical protein
MWWGVSVTPRPIFTSGKDMVPIIQEAGWAPGPVWTGPENLAPTGIRSPDRPARSQSLYCLSYMWPIVSHVRYWKSIFPAMFVPLFVFGSTAPPPRWVRVSSSTRFLDYKQRRTTVGRNPLEKWSALGRRIYLTTHNTHNRETYMPPVGFEPMLSERTMGLGMTLPLTDMSTRYISWEVKATGTNGWNIYHIHVSIVLKSGSLNLLEISEILLACNGINLPFYFPGRISEHFEGVF